jgi:hypothetical protein
VISTDCGRVYPEKLAKLREHRGNREQEVKLLHVYVFGIPKCGTFIGVKLTHGINLRDVTRSAIEQVFLSNKKNFRAIAKKRSEIPSHSPHSSETDVLARKSQ